MLHSHPLADCAGPNERRLARKICFWGRGSAKSGYKEGAAMVLLNRHVKKVYVSRLLLVPFLQWPPRGLLGQGKQPGWRDFPQPSRAPPAGALGVTGRDLCCPMRRERR